jgi:pyridoxamine 5'-phosphate oxidase
MNHSGLTIGESFSGTDPYALFEAWFQEATRLEVNDSNTMALATVDENGLPNVRMVLMQYFDSNGFVFFTNLTSAKGRELLASRKAAVCFHWKSLRRQVRIRGAVETVSEAEADAYFVSRPRGSRIGAWASQQSQRLESREALQQAVADVEARYADADVPRPPHWSGFRIVPQEIEFWHDRPFRLHDRVIFTPQGEGWSLNRLYP